MACVAVSLTLSALGQSRGSISAGSPGMGRPQPPSVFNRPGQFHRGFHRGNGNGTVIYPYGYPFGYYDSFYDDRYAEPVAPPTPVVVVKDDRPPAPPVPVVQPAPVDPKIIEIPDTNARTGQASKTIPAVFILTDGRRVETLFYTITDSVLTIKEPHRTAQRIPLSDLNLEATLSANHERGLNLQLPENTSEILISF